MSKIRKIQLDRDRLYNAIFSKGPVHLWILVFSGDPGTNPLWIQRTNYMIPDLKEPTFQPNVICMLITYISKIRQLYICSHL